MTLEKLLKEVEQFQTSNLSTEDLKALENALYFKLAFVRKHLQAVTRCKK